jgi:excinuclease ABC subunit B
MAYNEAHGITPKTVIKSQDAIMKQTTMADNRKGSNPERKYYIEPEEVSLAAEPVTARMNREEIGKLADRTRKAMEKASRDMDFIEAARLRDEVKGLELLLAS